MLFYCCGRNAHVPTQDQVVTVQGISDFGKVEVEVSKSFDVFFDSLAM
jgi:hypothetical protein